MTTRQIFCEQCRSIRTFVKVTVLYEDNPPVAHFIYKCCTCLKHQRFTVKIHQLVRGREDK